MPQVRRNAGRFHVLSSPLTIHLEVTDSCNNSCPHCYGSSWVQQRKGAKPDIAQVARQIVANEVFDVVITGGEPLLLGIDELSKIFEIFTDRAIQYSLNSNGRLLSKRTCKLLKDCGLRDVLISLHSWVNALHDEIVSVPNAAIETKVGIQNALDQGLHVAVNQVIDNRNIDTMYTSAVELEKLGVHQLSVTRALSPLDAAYHIQMIDAVRFIDEFIKCKETLTIPVVSLLPIPFCADPRLRDLNVRLSCTGGISTAAVSCYGDVRFCPHDTRVWGNVLQEEFGSIWKRMARWRDDVAFPAECNQCSFVVDCRGGCRVASKLCCNDYTAKDPWARSAVTNYRRKVVLDEVDPDRPYALLSGIRWRRENEAFLLYYKGGHLLVNADGLEFLKCLPQKFVPSKLLNESLENREALYDFLRVLYHNGLLLTPA